MRSSARSERIGPTPASTPQRCVSPSSRHACIHAVNCATSNTYCVCTNSAPAAIFLPSRSARNASGGANGFSTPPISQPGGGFSVLPESSLPLIAHRPRRPQQLHGVEVEHAARFGMIAELLMIAGQEQHVGDAERGGAEQIGLQRQAVAIAALQLHHRLDVFFEREHAAGQTREPHHRALIVGDVGGVDPVVQRARAACGSHRDRPRAAG